MPLQFLVKLKWALTEPVIFGQGVHQCAPSLAFVIKPFLCLLHQGLVLQELYLQVLPAYWDICLMGQNL